MANLPHALSTARDDLCEALQPIVNHDKTVRNLPPDVPLPMPVAFPMPKEILDRVDSFVHALLLVPGAEKELRQRAEFIAGKTGPGSVFAKERDIVLDRMSRVPKEEFSRWERVCEKPPKGARIVRRSGCFTMAYWDDEVTDPETGETHIDERAEPLREDGTFGPETCVWEHDPKTWQGGCQWQKDCRWQEACLWRGDPLRNPILFLDDLEVPTLNLDRIRSSAFCEVLNQLEPGVVEHIKRWYAECVRIKKEAEIRQADGCRQLFLRYQGGLPDAPAEARYVRGMAEVPEFSDLWAEKMQQAAESLVEWAETKHAPPEDKRPTFCQVNDTWTIGFAGKRQSGIIGDKGFPDILFLIKNQGKQVEIADLPGNEGARDSVKGVAMATKDDRVKLLRQINKLREERPEAQPGHPLPPDELKVQEDTDRGIDALQRQFNQNFTQHGTPRVISGDLDKMIESSGKRFDRALKKIGKKLPDLATHLKAAVTIGKTCTYNPAPEVDWTTG